MARAVQGHWKYTRDSGASGIYEEVGRGKTKTKHLFQLPMVTSQITPHNQGFKTQRIIGLHFCIWTELYRDGFISVPHAMVRAT